jgi:hypothetical protein
LPPRPAAKECATIACVIVAWGPALLKQYLSWRPVLTVDQFWIAVLKILPYEITGAYGIIVGGYLVANDIHAVDWLFAAIVILSIFVFFFHAATGASRVTAMAMAVLFFLFALSMNAESFRHWLVDESISSPPLPYLLDAIVRPFPVLIAAVVIVLATASFRSILARPAN